MAEPLGIIQSGGLGDIVIALPIARHYHDRGWEIFWPLREEFLSHFRESVPWVRWIPIPTDAQGRYYYDEPAERLRAIGCVEIACLYQALDRRPDLSQVPWFQVQKFDEFKYTFAKVPFVRKWSLGTNCLTRFPDREQALARKVNPEGRPYALVHLAGSSYRADVDLGFLPEHLARIEISEQTDSIFDWLALMEGAEALVFIDSVFANLADQMRMQLAKYWIPRSPIFLSPVLGMHWNILPPPADSLAAQVVIPPPTGLVID